MVKYLDFIWTRGEGWLGFPDLWSGKKKPWWNWYLTPKVNFGEVRRAQLAKSTLLTYKLVPLGYFQIFKVCSDATERVGSRKQREASTLIQSLVKLQPWFLSLWWKTCLRQNCSLGSCFAVKDLPLGRTLWSWWWWYMDRNLLWNHQSQRIRQSTLNRLYSIVPMLRSPQIPLATKVNLYKAYVGNRKQCQVPKPSRWKSKPTHSIIQLWLCKVSHHFIK